MTYRPIRFRFQRLNFLRAAIGGAMACCLLMPRIALAQADTGRIKGVVTDSSGALLPNAKVTATRTESATSTTTTTGKDGAYTFLELQTGHYTITVEGKGFATLSSENNELDDGGALTINASLPAGNAEQVIVTSSEGEKVNTTTGEVSHVIDGETVRDLALNGRNYLDLLGTLPGSVVTNLGDAISETTSQSTTGINLNGARATANGLYLDGFINKDIGSNASQFNNVGVDFIEHVKISTSAFSAQYGSAAGPAINVVTRSGTNTYHGTVFEYVRNNYLDAANYFSRNATTYAAIPSHLRFNNFGGAIGAPAMKDKLFFFVGAEWKLIAQVTSPTAQTLPLQSQLAGNFTTYSSIGTPLCTLSGKPVTDNNINVTNSSLPSFCNVSSKITPAGRAVQGVYQYAIAAARTYAGTACTTGGCSNNGNTIYSLPLHYRNHEYIARVDYNLSPRQNMYGRWISDTHTTTNPIGSGALPVTPEHDEGPANNVLLSHTLVVSPSSYNEISFGALWSAVNQQPVGTDWLRSTYGFSYTPLYPTYPDKIGIPGISIYGYATAQSQYNLAFSHSTYMQGQDIFTKQWGKHSLKFGALLGRNRKDQAGDPASALGGVNFSPVGNSYTTGNGLADALLGNFATYTESSSNPVGFFRLWQTAAFVDDIWRILPKLSLNFGLRYEYMTPWISQQNNVATFYPSLYDPAQAVTVNQDGTVVPGSGNIFNGMRRAAGGVPANQVSRVPGATSAAVLAVPATVPAGFYPAQNTFAPRFGLAYDLFGNGKTAIRAGAGLFYDTPQGNAAYSALNTPPYLQSQEVFNGNLDSLANVASGKQYTLQDMYTLSPNEQRSYVYQYNFGVQQELQAGMFLQIVYVGSESRHLLRDPDINGADPYLEDCILGLYPSATLNYVRSVTNAQAAQIGCGTPKNNSFYTNGMYSGGGFAGYGAIYQWRTDVDANYNGLQTNLNRRVGKGRFTLAYTWAKALSTGSGDSDVDHILINSKTYYYGPTTFDRRNVVSATYIGQTPELRGHNFLLRNAFGSWMITGIARYQSPQQLTPTGTDPLGVSSRAVWAGLPVLYGHNPTQWWYTINPGGINNFSAPVAGQIGNAPVGIILGPNYVDVDNSFRKTFSIHEKYRLLVQLDAFNIFNHPLLSTPTVNVSGNTVVEINGVHDNAYLGITSAGRPRNVQGALRFSF